MAIKSGILLEADYVFTGTLIETSDSVTMITRIINSKTESTEGTFQLTVPKEGEVLELISE